MKQKLVNAANFTTFLTSPQPAPVLKRVEDKILMKREWAYHPFGLFPPQLLVPVYDFRTGMFSGENAGMMMRLVILLIELDPRIFNVPIRRDLIHNVFRYERHYNFKRTKITKTVGDVAGSGKKPRPQKGTGRARQGNKRASINYHGGKSFGSAPKEFRFPINKKVRLQAMKSLLTARLVESKIIVYNNTALESYKTKELAALLSPFGKSKLLILTAKSPNKELKKASENLTKLTILPAIVRSIL